MKPVSVTSSTVDLLLQCEVRRKDLWDGFNAECHSSCGTDFKKGFDPPVSYSVMLTSSCPLRSDHTMLQCPLNDSCVIQTQGGCHNSVVTGTVCRWCHASDDHVTVYLTRGECLAVPLGATTSCLTTCPISGLLNSLSCRGGRTLPGSVHKYIYTHTCVHVNTCFLWLLNCCQSKTCKQS